MTSANYQNPQAVITIITLAWVITELTRRGSDWRAVSHCNNRSYNHKPWAWLYQNDCLHGGVRCACMLHCSLGYIDPISQNAQIEPQDFRLRFYVALIELKMRSVHI